MNITTARTWAANGARNATGDTSFYGVDKLDMAIMLLGQDFARLTRSLLRCDTLAITSGSVDLPTLPTGFRPQRLHRAYLVGSNVVVDQQPGAPSIAWYGRGQPIGNLGTIPGRQTAVRVVTFEELLDQAVSAPQSGQPTIVAFSSWTAGKVFPTPSDNYSLVLRWDEPFFTWTPGTTDAPTLATTLNLPDDWLAKALFIGTPAYLHATEKENQSLAAEARQRFEGFCAQIAATGDGTLGAASVASPARPW